MKPDAWAERTASGSAREVNDEPQCLAGQAAGGHPRAMDQAAWRWRTDSCLLGRDDNERRAVLERPVEHGFDVVAVGIEYESTVVAGVVRALTRSAVVSSSGSERCFVEGVNPFAIGRRKARCTREMYPSALSTNSSSA